MSVAKRFNIVTTYNGFSLPFMLRICLIVSPALQCFSLLRTAFPNHQIIPREDSLIVLSSKCDLLLHIRKRARS